MTCDRGFLRNDGFATFESYGRSSAEFRFVMLVSERVVRVQARCMKYRELGGGAVFDRDDAQAMNSSARPPS